MPVDLLKSDETTLGGGASPQREGEGFILKGGHVLAILVTFFTIVALVNAFMMFNAYKTMPGLETKSAYEVSQKFNTNLKKIDNQDALGWHIEAFTRGLRPGLPLVVEARDKTGQMLSKMMVDAVLRHPVDARKDLLLTLEEVRLGVYQAVIPASIPLGCWHLILSLKDRGETVFTSQHLLDWSGSTALSSPSRHRVCNAGG